MSDLLISGPEVFLETGKVVGQNSTRMAGQVIVGVSAAFLVWDVVDLGWTISDLIRLGISLDPLFCAHLESTLPTLLLQKKRFERRQDPER